MVFIYEYEKYVSSIDNVRQTIDTYGVAIIPHILDANECNDMVNGMWDYLEHITQKFNVPINRNIPGTWKQIKELYPLHSMLIQHWGIGHAQFIWNLRQNPKIVDIFSKIWGVDKEELLVSFDGASFHMPPETTKSGWYNNKNWLHTDQSYTRNDFECIQSWVTGFDVNDGDATLTILEGSNKHHKEFATKFNKTDKSDWNLLSDDEVSFYINEKKCRQVFIKCPAGSIVLWDSRTIHCGSEAKKNRPLPNTRCVAYLCYIPRDFASYNNIHKKIHAFNNLRTTTHYPHKGKLFSKTPRTYGKKLQDITQINKPILSDLGLKLVGY